MKRTISARELDAIKADVRRETMLECAEIAALESHYWAELDDEEDRPHMRDISLGACGAAANICGALAMGRTVWQVKEEIVKRKRPRAQSSGGGQLATNIDT